MIKLLAILSCFSAALIAAAAMPMKMTLEKDGKANFRLVTLEKQDNNSRVAVASFQKLVKESTGAKVDAIRECELSSVQRRIINIHIGLTDYVQQQKLDLPRHYGFIIHFVDAENVILAGAIAEGCSFNTANAISCFLEKFLGMRFLMPGEIGTHIPDTTGIWTIKQENIRRIPDCFVRQMHNIHGFKVYGRTERYQQQQCFTWAQHLGGTGGNVLRIDHNVGNLLAPEKYARTNPEFFPMVDGWRRIPPEIKEDSKWKVINWEPCYTARGIAEEAAKNIIE